MSDQSAAADSSGSSGVRPEPWYQAALAGLAREIARLEKIVARGELAALRRIDPARPSEPSLFRLIGRAAPNELTAEPDRMRPTSQRCVILQLIVLARGDVIAPIRAARGEGAGDVNLRQEVAVALCIETRVLESGLIDGLGIQDGGFSQHEVGIIAGGVVAGLGVRRRQPKTADAQVIARVETVLETSDQGVIRGDSVVETRADAGAGIRCDHRYVERARRERVGPTRWLSPP